MKKIFCILMMFVILSFSMTSCGSDTNPSEDNKVSEILAVEKESIVVGKLSPEHEYYKQTVKLDPKCVDYITEISIYDKEIDDTFVVHVSLPPEYDDSKVYPMIVMTDGVWRLSDHPELRQLMKDGEIKPVIVVSVGYPNGYNYKEIRQRDFLKEPEKYLHFIVDNLVPYLSDQYSVDSENMTLAGHSYGGYWGFYALFSSDTIGKNTFRNYFIGSPAFQASTGFKNIQSFEKAYFKRNKTLNCNVYVTAGNYEPTQFVEPIDNFIDFLKKRNYEGLNLSYEIIDGYNHDNVFKPSIKRAMLLFYGTEDNQQQDN